jgi:hypothetical protein
VLDCSGGYVPERRSRALLDSNVWQSFRRVTLDKDSDPGLLRQGSVCGRRMPRVAVIAASGCSKISSAHRPPPLRTSALGSPCGEPLRAATGRTSHNAAARLPQSDGPIPLFGNFGAIGRWRMLERPAIDATAVCRTAANSPVSPGWKRIVSDRIFCRHADRKSCSRSPSVAACWDRAQRARRAQNCATLIG